MERMLVPNAKQLVERIAATDEDNGWTDGKVLDEVVVTNCPDHSDFDVSLHGLTLSQHNFEVHSHADSKRFGSKDKVGALEVTSSLVSELSNRALHYYMHIPN